MIRRLRAGFVLVFLGLFAAPSHLGAQPATPPQTSPTPGMPRRDPTQQQQQQQQEAGTAVIKGRVVALDTGAPLRHVQIRVMGEKMRSPRSTLTDAQGVYEFKELVPGRYSLMASKGGFVTLQYGQRGPRDMGRSIQLADKQTLDKIDMALPRGAVITGRVVDEAGEPVSDVAVTALQYRLINGKRRLSGGRPAMTNDIGQYRIYGLAPGEYYVNVNGRMNQMMGPDTQTDDASGYAPTFYPSAPSAAEAQKLTIGVGEEVVADIQLTPTRIVRVTGAVLTSTGKPATAGMAMLQQHGNDVNGNMGGGTSPLRPDGTFVINGATTGSYRLIVMANPAGGDMFTRDGMESAVMPLTVGGQDITDLRLVTTAGIALSGRMVFEGGTPEPGVAKQIRVSCLSMDQDAFTLGAMPGTADDEGKFEIKNVSVPCLVSVFGNQTWMLKSVMLNGVDITDRPIEPASKPMSGFEITMTNRLSTITGTVTSAQDQPAKEYTVIVFPEETQRWQPPVSGRYMRQGRPDQTGTFKLPGLPPGHYLVAAFENIEEGAARDPEFLTQVQSRATRVELSEGGTQTVSLKLLENH